MPHPSRSSRTRPSAAPDQVDAARGTDAQPSQAGDLSWAALAVLIGLAVAVACTSWSSDGDAWVMFDAIRALSRALIPTGAWLAAATGYGLLVMSRLGVEARGRAMVTWTIGIAMLLVLDIIAGLTGFTQMFGAVGAWFLIAGGLVPLCVALWRTTGSDTQVSIRFSPLAVPAAFAVAVLIVAATSAPGYLWDSEFGGYDALSYHLQLPREWMDAGRITALEHNVYSFLPSYVEAAYYHVMVLAGDVAAGSYACQLLHACITVLAAGTTCAAARTLFGSSRAASTAATVAGVFLIGTPWVIVVGSLAYNEMFVGLMLAAGLAIAADQSIKPLSRGVLIGICCAAAAGAKLTAAGLVGVPLVVAMLVFARQRRVAMFVVCCAVGLAIMFPWLIRNALATGNPVFPFLTSILSTGHWTSEQAAIFAAGHASDLGVFGRLGELWHQFIRFGMGPNPDETGFEPWFPQWSVLPLLGLCGVIVVWKWRPEQRKAIAALSIIVFIQIVFWLTATHLKSRFLLPAVVPMSMLAGALVLMAPPRGRWIMFVTGAALLAWCALPLWVYKQQRDGRPAQFLGRISMMTGDYPGLDDARRRETGRTQSPTIFLNHLLPPDASVLLIGDATPLLYRCSYTYQTTWDRGPMSRAMDRFPDDPQGWINDLHSEGFTHVLVDASMLYRWINRGRADERLTSAAVLGALEAHAQRVAQYPNGIVIYALRSSE